MKNLDKKNLGMTNPGMTQGKRFGMSFSKIRGAVCSFTVVSLLALSLAALGGLAGAQTRDIKWVGGSGGLAASGAGGHAPEPENAHSNLTHIDVFYSFCTLISNLGNCLGFQPVASVILDNGNAVPGALYGTDLGDWGPPCVGAGATGGANPLECDPPYLPRGQMFMYSGGVETVLHQFNNFSGDGWNPAAALTQDATGNLYGTTYGGGASPTGYDNCIPTGGCGTVFELSTPFGTSGSYKILYNFEGGPLGGTMDGANPAGTLIEDSGGNLYGTTVFGGLYSQGTVFVLCNPNAPAAAFSCPMGAGGAWMEQVIYNFGASGPADGASPVAGLIADASGNLYSTTEYGGPAGSGTVFELCAPGVASGDSSPCANNLPSWQEHVLYSFCAVAGCADGANPVAGLIQTTVGPKSFLLGTTEWGGTAGAGTVFAIENSTDYVIYSFCVKANCSDGANPVGGLIMDGSGTVYGTTEAGGNYTCQTFPASLGGCGTAFSIANPLVVGSMPQTFYTFCNRSQCPDGMGPAAALTPNGADYTHLFGTTQYGAIGTQGGQYQAYSGGQGTVFEFYPCSIICVAVQPGTMSWGNVAVGAMGVGQFVKVTNNGTQAVQITSIEISGEFAFTKVKKGGCVSGGILKPGATCEIGATFDPTQTGYQTGQITITEKADGAMQTVALSGTGVE